MDQYFDIRKLLDEEIERLEGYNFKDVEQKTFIAALGVRINQISAEIERLSKHDITYQLNQMNIELKAYRESIINK
jgi:hypothetical protein